MRCRHWLVFSLAVASLVLGNGFASLSACQPGTTYLVVFVSPSVYRQLAAQFPQDKLWSCMLSKSMSVARDKSTCRCHVGQYCNGVTPRLPAYPSYYPAYRPMAYPSFAFSPGLSVQSPASFSAMQQMAVYAAGPTAWLTADDKKPVANPLGQQGLLFGSDPAAPQAPTFSTNATSPETNLLRAQAAFAAFRERAAKPAGEPVALPTFTTTALADVDSAAKLIVSGPAAPVGNPPAPTDDPSALPRMQFVLLQVTGMQGSGDPLRLTAALEQVQGVRGVSVRRQADDSLLVKVWYSSKEPVAGAQLVAASAKLGLTGTIVD